MNILFYTNQLDLRGGGQTLYDYAHHNEILLGNKSFIATDGNKSQNEHPAQPKFEKRFNQVFKPKSPQDMEAVVRENHIDLWYEHCAWGKDEPIPHNCRVAVHNIFQSFEPHGNIYAYVSEWLRDLCVPEHLRRKYGFVHHMVSLPDISEDLRDELHIPANARVFGYHGGPDSFDIQFARDAIHKALDRDQLLYFVFLQITPWINHPRVFFLPATSDVEYKVKFINTCDAAIHARQMGETFGVSLAELSIKNKPILAHKHAPSYGACHIKMHKTAMLYDNEENLIDLLLHANLDKTKLWNSLGDSLSPAKIMEQFNRVFIKGDTTVKTGTDIEIVSSCNVAIIKGDNGVGAWVHEVGRLDYDRNFLDFVIPHIKKDQAALDIGAYIGSHTLEYLKHAKEVIAFEPNPTAFACLSHNCPHAIRHNVALGDKFYRRYLTKIFPNCGASYLTDESSPDCLTVSVRPLDSFALPDKIGYIKMDVEGEEGAVLRGGRQTILKHKPILCLEVNHSSMKRTKTSAEELYALLNELGYDIKPVPGTQRDIQLDVLAIPR